MSILRGHRSGVTALLFDRLSERGSRGNYCNDAGRRGSSDDGCERRARRDLNDDDDGDDDDFTTSMLCKLHRTWLKLVYIENSNNNVLK